MAVLVILPTARPVFPVSSCATALACLLFLAGCTSGKPGTTNRFYSVHAETSAGFVQSVRSRAPRSGRAFGLVEITFHPDYRLVGGKNGCRTEVRNVALELVIVLPKWRDGKIVPASIRPKWKRFENTVRQHEMHHVRIARDYAARMRRAIAKARSSESCRDLGARVREKVARIKAQHLSAQDKFDRREARRLKNLL